MDRKERLTARNNQVRSSFNELCKKHPQWRFDALVKQVAGSFFLSKRTVEAILRGEGIYSE